MRESKILYLHCIARARIYDLTSSFSSWSTSVIFNSSLQRWLSAFVVAYLMPSEAENASDWSLARRLCNISCLKANQLHSKVTGLNYCINSYRYTVCTEVLLEFCAAGNQIKT